MANQAVEINPPVFNGIAADIHLTSHGSDWLWALFAVFALYFVLLLAFTIRLAPATRFFHYLVLAVLLIASISTFTVASDLGFVPIPVEWVRDDAQVAGTLRQIFWVRYVDWFLTSPLLLAALLFSAAVPLPTVLITGFFSSTAVIAGLSGALVPSTYKWGYFTFGVAALFFILYTLLITGRKYASALGTDISRTYTVSTLIVLLLSIIYPIAWGVAEGGNIIGSDGEAAFYGVLDLLAKVVFTAVLLFGIRDVDVSRVGWRLRASDEPVPGAAVHVEKNGNGESAA